MNTKKIKILNIDSKNDNNKLIIAKKWKYK